MKKLCCCPVTIVLLLSAFFATAQDSVRFNRDSLRNRRDTSRQATDTGRARRGMSSLFADSATLTSSDYQLQIEKAYVILNNIENKSELGPAIDNIKEKLADNDSMLAVLKDNILNNTQALNLRNLQVFRTLLQNMQSDLRKRREKLDSTENMLADLRNSLKTLVGDTILRQLQRDSALRQQFLPQLRVMRETWRAGTRHLRQSLATINLLQTHTSSNSIATNQLLERVDNLLTTSAARIFGKEYNYLWEKDTVTLSGSARSSFRKAYMGERKALRYYFNDSGNKRLLLLLVGLLFFAWTYRNIRVLKQMNALENVKQLGFDYLPSGFIVSTFVIVFSIAPLFDLHAPSAYIESMQFLLLIILTIICWKKWPRKLFVYWIAMAILYICFSLSHHIVDPGLLQRLWLILLNVLSIVFGLLFLSKMQQHLHLKGFLRFVILLHNVMNVLAIIFNTWGRFSLAQILGNAAIFAFMQAIGLAVFSKICMEAILLQIVTSRIKRGVKSRFEYGQVLKSFGRPILFLAIVLWLIVFATNLNVYTSVLNGLADFLQKPRYIGNASFTLGGVLLFL